MAATSDSKCLRCVPDDQCQSDCISPENNTCRLLMALRNENARLKTEIQTLRTILEHSYDEVYVTDGQGNTILANSACERHYGLKPEEMIGKHVSELEAKGVFFPAITPIALRERRRVTIEQETQIGRRLMVTATPVIDESGNITMVVENSRDITAVEEMKKAFEQVKQAASVEKTEDLGPRVSAFSDIVAYSSKMKQVLEAVIKVGCSDTTVLLQGETGVGKDLVADLIHKLGDRRSKPFIKINCAAIPDDLIESELFGYAPGAFTGARYRGKVGLVRLAEGGTLFLDEVAELPFKVQAKLLHLLQDKSFFPLGSSRPSAADVRIITATNQDLNELVKKNLFRQDLFYRLNVIQITIPPLRERKEDIVPLIYYFLHNFSKKYNKDIDIDPEALAVLVAYSWPGNVRELQHVIERSVLFGTTGKLCKIDLPKHILEVAEKEARSPIPEKATLREEVLRLEKERVLKAYATLRSSYKVAEALGISQSTAHRKIRKYTSAP